MSSHPTADDIAIAVVVACRETGGDPIACVGGAICSGGPNAPNLMTARARHFALHALIHIFPQTDKLKFCGWVGAPGNPKAFWNNSWHQVAKPRVSGRGHIANWFEDEICDRIIRAIEADRTRRNIAPLSYRPPADTIKKMVERPSQPKLGTRDANGYRPPSDAIEKILDKTPVFDRGGNFAAEKPREFGPRKSDLTRELREAAANTAKLPIGQ